MDGVKFKERELRNVVTFLRNMVITECVTIYEFPVTEPLILTDPYKGRHMLRWSKSRGQPDTGRQGLASREPSFNMSLDDDDIGSGSIPYRLPRLSPRDMSPNHPDVEQQQQQVPEDGKSPTNDKVWSRYGFEKIVRIPELGPTVRVLMPPPPPRTSCSMHQYRSSATPRFKHAAITPTVRSLPWAVGKEAAEEQRQQQQVYNSYHADSPVPTLGRGKEAAEEQRQQQQQVFNSISASGHRVHHDDLASRSTRFEPTPTPISRSDSPAKSVKSIHWVLGHNRYHTFDKKGRSHVQGPYSREFNVTCMAPSNWLKMKWGRSKTMIT